MLSSAVKLVLTPPTLTNTIFRKFMPFTVITRPTTAVVPFTAVIEGGGKIRNDAAVAWGIPPSVPIDKPPKNALGTVNVSWVEERTRTETGTPPMAIVVEPARKFAPVTVTRSPGEGFCGDSEATEGDGITVKVEASETVPPLASTVKTPVVERSNVATMLVRLFQTTLAAV